MKIVIVLAVALVSVEAVRFAKIIDKEWKDFKTQFGKQYASPDVELVRKIIFADNLYTIGEHNQKYVKGLVTWLMGINSFADQLGIELPLGLIRPGEDPDAVLKYLHVEPK